MLWRVRRNREDSNKKVHTQPDVRLVRLPNSSLSQKNPTSSLRGVSHLEERCGGELQQFVWPGPTQNPFCLATARRGDDNKEFLYLDRHNRHSTEKETCKM